jgi:hypothetical protein
VANELNVSVNLSFYKSGARINKNYSNIVTVIGDAFVSGVIQIGNTEEELTQLNELVNIGYVLLKSLGALTDGNIYVGFTDGGDDSKKPIILKPGEIALYRHNYAEVATLYARTSVGTVNLEYTIIED